MGPMVRQGCENFPHFRPSNTRLLRESLSNLKASSRKGVIWFGFAMVLRAWGVNKKGPVYVAMFKPLGIVIAAIMGIIFLGETLHLGSVIGSIIIVFGFYSVMWGKAKEEKLGRDKITVPCLESSTKQTPLLQSHKM